MTGRTPTDRSYRAYRGLRANLYRPPVPVNSLTVEC